MKLNHIAKLIVSVAVVAAVGQAQAVVHSARKVTAIHTPDTRDCTFFTLEGTTVADPVVAGNAWFAVPKTHLGYKEIVSLLMLARTTGQALTTVETTGATACGVAAVLKVVN